MCSGKSHHVHLVPKGCSSIEVSVPSSCSSMHQAIQAIWSATGCLQPATAKGSCHQQANSAELLRGHWKYHSPCKAMNMALPIRFLLPVCTSHRSHLWRSSPAWAKLPVQGCVAFDQGHGWSSWPFGKMSGSWTQCTAGIFAVTLRMAFEAKSCSTSA